MRDSWDQDSSMMGCYLLISCVMWSKVSNHPEPGFLIYKLQRYAYITRPQRG